MLIVSNLTKKYENNRGIFDINLEIAHGSISSFVGPNGSGKTTLFKVINKITPFDTGKCSLDDIDYENVTINNIGYLDEKPFLFLNFTVEQFLLYIKLMKNIDVSDDEIDSLLNLFSLSDVKHGLIKNCSQGMQKRVAICSALLGNPKLIILDEPTNSLDTENILILKQVLKQMKEQNKIILVSSHILDFVKDISDKVYFIKNGNIVASCNNNTINLDDEYINIYKKI